MIQTREEDINKLNENIDEDENVPKSDCGNLKNQDEETVANKFSQHRKRETSIHDNEPPSKKRELSAENTDAIAALEHNEEHQSLNQEFLPKNLEVLKNEPVHVYNKKAPVVGLGYILKMFNSKNTIEYYCVLCNSRCLRSIYEHVVSSGHEMFYMNRHFPKLLKKLQVDLKDVNPNTMRKKLICDTFRAIYRKVEEEKGLRDIYFIDGKKFAEDMNFFLLKVRKTAHYDEARIEISEEEIEEIIEQKRKATIISKVHSQDDGPGTHTDNTISKHSNCPLSHNNITQTELSLDKGAVTPTLGNYEDHQSLKQEVPFENMKISQNELIPVDNQRTPVVGLCYILKMFNSENITEYFCVLCNSGCLRSIDEHVISSGHEMCYLNHHFPKLLKKLQVDLKDVIPNKLKKKLICETFRAIYGTVEVARGFQEINLIDGKKFAEDANFFLRKVRKSAHYDETCIDLSDKEIEELIEQKRKVAVTIKVESQNEIKPLMDIKFCDQSDYKPVDKDISNNNWERYRVLIGSALKDLEREYETYKCNGTSHPKYIQEWKKFFISNTQGYMQDKMKFKSKAQLRAEWLKYWPKLLKVIYKKDIQRKKIEIKRNLHLPRNKRTPTAIRKGRSPTCSPQPPELPPKTFTSKPTSRRERRCSKSPEHVNHQLQIADQVSTGPLKPLNVISVLRQLTILEEELGSLGPKALEFLSRAVLFEQENNCPANELLKEREFYIFFATVKEKLKSQLRTNLVETNKTNVAKSSVSDLQSLLDMFEDFIRQNARENSLNVNDSPPQLYDEMTTSNSDRHKSFSFRSHPEETEVTSNRIVNNNHINRQNLFNNEGRDGETGFVEAAEGFSRNSETDFVAQNQQFNLKFEEFNNDVDNVSCQEGNYGSKYFVNAYGNSSMNSDNRAKFVNNQYNHLNSSNRNINFNQFSTPINLGCQNSDNAFSNWLQMNSKANSFNINQSGRLPEINQFNHYNQYLRQTERINSYPGRSNSMYSGNNTNREINNSRSFEFGRGGKRGNSRFFKYRRGNRSNKL